MKNKEYAIVDIETTGGRANRHRVTEVGIVIFDGEKVLETYESLINPESWIPFAGNARLLIWYHTTDRPTGRPLRVPS